jgi:hypothetical protein
MGAADLQRLSDDELEALADQLSTERQGRPSHLTPPDAEERSRRAAALLAECGSLSAIPPPGSEARTDVGTRGPAGDRARRSAAPAPRPVASPTPAPDNAEPVDDMGPEPDADPGIAPLDDHRAAIWRALRERRNGRGR